MATETIKLCYSLLEFNEHIEIRQTDFLKNVTLGDKN